MIANTNPNYDMIYAGHEKLPPTLLWYSADPSTQDQEKGIYFNNRATFINFFFQEGLVEEKGRNAFMFTSKYLYIS